MATQETPIHQLPQTPQGGSGNAPSADPMIQNILNNYNQQQQTPEQMEASLPTTAEDIYDNEQAKYQDRQFGLQPPLHPKNQWIIMEMNKLNMKKTNIKKIYLFIKNG